MLKTKQRYWLREEKLRKEKLYVQEVLKHVFRVENMKLLNSHSFQKIYIKKDMEQTIISEKG